MSRCIEKENGHEKIKKGILGRLNKDGDKHSRKKDNIKVRMISVTKKKEKNKYMKEREREKSGKNPRA